MVLHKRCTAICTGHGQHTVQDSWESPWQGHAWAVTHCMVALDVVVHAATGKSSGDVDDVMMTPNASSGRGYTFQPSYCSALPHMVATCCQATQLAVYSLRDLHVPACTLVQQVGTGHKPCTCSHQQGGWDHKNVGSLAVHALAMPCTITT